MSWKFWKTDPIPDDKIVYHPGFSCQHGHCQDTRNNDASYSTLFGVVEICGVCGENSNLSLIKTTIPYRGYYRMTHEFVRYLDEGDKVNISGETLKWIEALSVRPPSVVAPEEIEGYRKGLLDGSTELAKYILSQLEEETE